MDNEFWVGCKWQSSEFMNDNYRGLLSFNLLNIPRHQTITITEVGCEICPYSNESKLIFVADQHEWSVSSKGGYDGNVFYDFLADCLGEYVNVFIMKYEYRLINGYTCTFTYPIVDEHTVVVNDKKEICMIYKIVHRACGPIKRILYMKGMSNDEHKSKCLLSTHKRLLHDGNNFLQELKEALQ